MYVHTWLSCLGMSICAHAQGPALLEDVDEGMSFLMMEDGEESTAGPLLVCCRWHCYSCCALVTIQTATNS